MPSNSLFPGIAPEVPTTEGIKYAGSKLKLLQPILELAETIEFDSVFDAFAGTSRVGQAFAKTGKRVIANDISVWSEVFCKCYLLNRNPRSDFQGLIEHLNNIAPRDGWFTEHYGGDKAAKSPELAAKRPWQKHNTRKLDAIREEIDALDLSEHERSVAITSLILALDKVDSTLGHFASYLREWSARSHNDLKLLVPKLFLNTRENEVIRGNATEQANKVVADLAYLDPPYGSNNEKMPPSRVRYSAYYHVYTSVCLNDKPEIFGKVNRRKDSSDTATPSKYESFKRCDNSSRFEAVVEIERLLKNLRCKYAILSYSSGGRATAEELHQAISTSGSLIEVHEIEYKKNVMANMRWTDDWIADSEKPNLEFLFLVKMNR
jgi:adenine-specific DNA-methyltransferase